MKSSNKKVFDESIFIQFIEGIFNVKSTNCIMECNKQSKENSIKKNELDYFEYTYISDSA